MDGQHDTFNSPSWVSHLPAGPQSIYRVSDKSGFSYTITVFCDWKRRLSLYSIPGNTPFV
jgi:hypothetical protein